MRRQNYGQLWTQVRQRLVLRTGLALVPLLACTTLKTATLPPEPNQEEPDASADPIVDARAAIDATSDAAPPKDAGADVQMPKPEAPLDTPCAEPWALATKTDRACNPRVVRMVETLSEGPRPMLSIDSLSLSRTPQGRIGLVYTGDTGPEDGDLHFVQFSPAATSFQFPNVRSVAPNLVYQRLVAARIASGPNEDFHLVYQVNDQGEGGEIQYRTLGPSNAMSAPQVLASAGPRTQLSLALSPSGDAWVNYYVPGTAASTGFIATKVRAATTGMFGPSIVFLQNIPQALVPGAGRSVIRFDSGVASAVGFRPIDERSGSSTYAEVSGVQWATNRRQFSSPTRRTGHSIDLAHFGGRKFVAYFEINGTTNRADLMSGSWATSGEVLSPEVLRADLRADGEAPELALAVDSFGLVHVAYVHQLSGSGTSKCDVMYKRQTSTAGKLIWIEDAIARNMACESLRVAMVVDEKARPHIAYNDIDHVYYATRFDR
jgi:hypothetical protein